MGCTSFRQQKRPGGGVISPSRECFTPHRFYGSTCSCSEFPHHQAPRHVATLVGDTISYLRSRDFSPGRIRRHPGVSEGPQEEFIRGHGPAQRIWPRSSQRDPASFESLSSHRHRWHKTPRQPRAPHPINLKPLATAQNQRFPISPPPPAELRQSRRSTLFLSPCRISDRRRSCRSAPNFQYSLEAVDSRKPILLDVPLHR